MSLLAIDWTIIALYFIVSIGIGVYMSKRGGRSTGDFFLSGRNLPWYIAGTSMVATTFAADTPLAVTELVAQNGIAGNWVWWNMLIGGMLTVFFFARLWRRSDIMTDAEFVAIRYSGKAALFLRGFRSVYIGVFMNLIVIAWVNLAMVKILGVLFPNLTFFGIKELGLLGFTFDAYLLTVGALLLFVAFYSALAGLWGVSLTDSFQFIMAMTGSIALAIYAVTHSEVGGIDGITAALPEWIFQYTPDVGSVSETSSASGVLKLTVLAFIAYIGVQWWASWYPGAEPGGGGYVAQRMMSAKDEKHSLLATLWFQVAHFALRPWPWILVALVALVVLPKAPGMDALEAENPVYYETATEIFNHPQINKTDVDLWQHSDFQYYYEKYENTADPGRMYPKLMLRYLPTGLLGLMVAAFLAAFMSTIASQTNWGTSYIINDLFKPFIKPGASEKYYVAVARITTVLLLLLSLFVTTMFGKISDAWKFILACSGGIGLVLIFRWFWWRINAWSEIAAMLAPYAVYPVLKYYFELPYEESLIIIVLWSTLVWLVVTFLTPPSDEQKLLTFYRKVHPGGRGWRHIAAKLPDVEGDTGYGALFINWVAGCILVLFSLFGFGKLIFAQWLTGSIYLVVALLAGGVIFYNLSRVGWEKIKK